MSTLTVAERDPCGLVVDHLRLIADRRYGREVRLKIIKDLHTVVSGPMGSDRAVWVRHAPDRQCCELQACMVSFERLLAQLQADDVPAYEVRMALVGAIDRVEIGLLPRPQS